MDTRRFQAVEMTDEPRRFAVYDVIEHDRIVFGDDRQEYFDTLEQAQEKADEMETRCAPLLKQMKELKAAIKAVRLQNNFRDN